MKNSILALVLLVLSTAVYAATYYVNIDNAPNGSAEGTITCYDANDPNFIYGSASLIFIENYYGGAGGKYMATNLPEPTAQHPLLVKCIAYRLWGCDKIYGYSEQVFTNQSYPPFQLPTIHLPIPVPPTDPPYPK